MQYAKLELTFDFIEFEPEIRLLSHLFNKGNFVIGLWNPITKQIGESAPRLTKPVVISFVIEILLRK